MTPPNTATSSRPSLSYRPYLDGVRALAVLLVFVFHAARPGLPGGFIGVDVFFVLSGYLITRILITEHESSGRIRLLRFYSRRVKRLMPAVIVLVLVVVAREALYGDILMLGARLRDAIATLFYYMNWNLIWQTDQYSWRLQRPPRFGTPGRSASRNSST